MKNNILCMVAVWALMSCIPSPVQDRPNSGVRSDNFSIAPEGTWLPNCQDVASAATDGALVAHQLKAVFAEQEPTFTLSHDFLSQNCKQDEAAVALHKRIKGKIKLGEHSNLDDGRRARAVEIEVSSESYTPKSKVGLTYLRMVVSDKMSGQLAIDKETVIPKDHMPYSKLYGMLVVKKNARNAMHVYLDPRQKSTKDIVPHLNDSNLYFHHITK